MKPAWEQLSITTYKKKICLLQWDWECARRYHGTAVKKVAIRPQLLSSVSSFRVQTRPIDTLSCYMTRQTTNDKTHTQKQVCKPKRAIGVNWSINLLCLYLGVFLLILSLFIAIHEGRCFHHWTFCTRERDRDQWKFPFWSPALLFPLYAVDIGQRSSMMTMTLSNSDAKR